MSVDEIALFLRAPLDFSSSGRCKPVAEEAAFTQFELVQAHFKGGLDRMVSTGSDCDGQGARPAGVADAVRNLVMESGVDASLTIAGTLAINVTKARSRRKHECRRMTRSFRAGIGDVRLTPFLSGAIRTATPARDMRLRGGDDLRPARTATEKPAVSMIRRHIRPLYQTEIRRT